MDRPSLNDQVLGIFAFTYQLRKYKLSSVIITKLSNPFTRVCSPNRQPQQWSGLRVSTLSRRKCRGLQSVYLATHITSFNYLTRLTSSLPMHRRLDKGNRDGEKKATGGATSSTSGKGDVDGRLLRCRCGFYDSDEDLGIG